MKKILFVLIFVVLIFPLVSSVGVQMKEEFERGETLVAKISGSFEKPPQESNIKFERNGGYVPFDKNLVKFSEGEYFLSAVVPVGRAPGNYTMAVENVEYAIPGDQTSSKDIVREFEVLDSYADFSVKPAVIYSKSGKFSLELENLKAEDIVVEANKEGVSRTFEEDTNESWSFSSWFGGSSDSADENESYSPERSISLDSTGPDIEKEVTFDLGDVEKGINTISLSTEEFGQEIFIYVSESTSSGGSNDGKSNQVLSKNTASMDFESSSIEINMSSNATTSKILRLENTGDKKLRDVGIGLQDSGKAIEDYLEFTDYIAILEINETHEVDLNISSPETVNGTEKFGGAIKATWKNESSNESVKEFVSISLNFIESYSHDQVDVSSNESSDEISPAVEKTCAALDGDICGDGKKCKNGNTTSAENGVCCLSQCVAEEEGGSSGAIVGWVILGLLILVVVWFYFNKYKKTKNKPSLNKYTKDSGKK
ncbi:MAG: hypothetical protein ABEI74_01030 [Candidatus Pacearchaeota archaeon]